MFNQVDNKDPLTKSSGRRCSAATRKRSRSCMALFRGDESDQQQHPFPVVPSNLYVNGSERLPLPTRGSVANLDEYLSSLPSVASRAKELLQLDCFNVEGGPGEPTDAFRILENCRCLNVLQGEVAHASPDQADVIISAEATTCHVVALWSTNSIVSGKTRYSTPPLATLAHCDKAYHDCFEKMILEHITHHSENECQNLAGDEEMDGLFIMEEDEKDFSQCQQEETTTTTATKSSLKRQHNSFLPQMGFPKLDKESNMKKHSSTGDSERINMELHIAGGYLDKGGISQKLTTLIIERFDVLARKYRDRLKISLFTAAVSSLNTKSDDNNAKSEPIGRGLGIDTRTGQVFAVKSSIPHHLQGPGLEVRTARLFSDEYSSSLAVIHDRYCRNGEIRVWPFTYKQRTDLNVLLNVPDSVLLSIASTSPDTESDQFCSSFRRTLSFVNTVPAETVFGRSNKPLVYTRSTGALNAWEQVREQKTDQNCSSPLMF